MALSVALVTLTVKEQTADRAMASLAVHVTVVDPIGKVEPDAGAQVVVTGGVPPWGTGVT